MEINQPVVAIEIATFSQPHRIKVTQIDAKGNFYSPWYYVDQVSPVRPHSIDTMDFINNHIPLITQDNT